jgi:hypothetical protein|tara:strand:- start:143 stop:370 length:228 start_codon:yes stop_codon:yes gene_type:complete
MPIPKEKYKELKAMFDFQRKKQYNKEKLKKAIDIMFEHPEVMFDDLWGKMKDEDMVEAPSDWIPKDDKLKIEGEE